jgi:hypothetical protein
MLDRVAEHPLRKEQDMLDYYYNNGASDVNFTHFKLILQGRRNIEIRLVDIRAVILKRSERLGEGASVLTPGPQGQDESVELGFDLDGSDLSAKEIVEPLNAFYGPAFFGERIFQKSTVTLARNEQQVFEVTARSFNYYVEWRLEIDLLIDGEVEVISVDSNGRPFRTCGTYPDPRSDDQTVPDENRYSEVYLMKTFDPRFGNLETVDPNGYVRVK